MTHDTLDTLWRYVGLRPNHVEALRDPTTASPAMRRALREGGLLDGDGLTPAGRRALELAEAILEDQWESPAPVAEVEYRRGMGRKAGMRSDRVKLLIYLARFPETCLRFLRGAWGNAPLAELEGAGLIEPATEWEAWSTPVRITPAGLEKLLKMAGRK